MATVACIAMAAVGMTAPHCLGGLDTSFTVVRGGSNYLAVANCDLPQRDEMECLSEFGSVCPKGTEVQIIQMPWRQVRANSGRVIHPKSYTHVLDCAEPGKETR